MSIQYTLIAANPQAHLFRVTLELSTPDPAGQVLSLPNWIPGSYMIRDFARNITSLSATSNGQSVVISKSDKSTWHAPAGLTQLSVEYEVYAWELTVRTAHLDTTHGFFNGTSVFLCVEGQEQQACDVHLVRPHGNPYKNWQVATAMPLLHSASSTGPALSTKPASSTVLATASDGGFSHYRVANYDELIDHPVEMGCFERFTFEACGVPHDVVLTGHFRTSAQQISKDLKLICEAQIRFFGEPPPMDRYVFLVMVVASGYGGLEHRASTSLLVTREHLPAPDSNFASITDGETDGKTGTLNTRSESYRDFLGLCSHEYFHTWNVKRIKPARFIPYELKAESHTELLWAFEGITSYYDDLFLVRSGVITRKQYLETLGKTITRVYRGAGRLRQSVAESSFDAWTRFYKADENAPNAIVSYYSKGALVAFCLDMLIREKSQHKNSLDDLMKTLWQRWLEDGKGVVQSDFESIASTLAGEDLSDFFDNAVFGTDDLDLDRALAVVGGKTQWRQGSSDSDAGGTEGGGTVDATRHSLGARTIAAAGALEITHVFDGGAAQRAGLAAGDSLLALDAMAVSDTPVSNILARHAVGESVQAHVFRHGVMMEFQVPVMSAPIDTCWLTGADQEPMEKGNSLLVGWLSSSESKA